MYNTCTTPVPQFWKNYGDEIRSYVRKHVRDEELAKDLSQEVFLKIYTFCQRYDFDCDKAGVKNLRSWLFQTAHNLIVDHLRHDKFRAEWQAVDVPENTESNTYQKVTTYLPPIIGCLPEAYAKPLLLADIEGFNQQEVANKLGLSLSATKSRIQRARLMLRDLLSECAYLETNAQGHLIAFEIKPNCKAVEEYLKKNS